MAQAGEQSVEQILHSIKQVMARDGAGDGARARATSTVTWNTREEPEESLRGDGEHWSQVASAHDTDPADEYEAGEILDLAQGGMMMGSDTSGAGRPAMPFDEGNNQSAEGDLLTPFDKADALPAEAHAEVEAHGAAQAVDAGTNAFNPSAGDELAGDEPLTSALTRDAMRGNLAALALLAESGGAAARLRPGETSLEGTVREMLRPMLAQWLDTHLPAVVERAVQAEVARIARAGR